MADDKIDLDGMPVRYVDKDQRFVSLGDVALLVNEIYRQAQGIGWETKVLDSLVEKLSDNGDWKTEVNPTYDKWG